MSVLFNGLLVGLEVPLEAFYLQGSRRKAVAERHALLLLDSNQKHLYTITIL